MTMKEESLALSCQQFELITEANIKINGLSNINETLSVHYLIYRIDNLKNGKHYIGQHQTENPLDTYMGSGKYLLRAIAKEGVENFVKTILFDFNNFEQMNEKEKELVPLSACYPDDKTSYNLKEGGNNGKLSKRSQIIRSKHVSETWKNKSPEEKKLHGLKCKHYGEQNGMYGRKRPQEEIERIVQTRIRNGSSAGPNNGMYGKCGKLSPNYGSKRSKEQRLRMSIGAKNRKKSKIWMNAVQSANMKRTNSKHMYNPITHESGFKSIDEIDMLIMAGWIVGKEPK